MKSWRKSPPPGRFGSPFAIACPKISEVIRYILTIKEFYTKPVLFPSSSKLPSTISFLEFLTPLPLYGRRWGGLSALRVKTKSTEGSDTQ